MFLWKEQIVPWTFQQYEQDCDHYKHTSLDNKET